MKTSRRKTPPSPYSTAEQLRYALAYEANAAAFAVALTEAAGGQTRREPDFTLALFPFPHSITGVYLPRFKAEDCSERIRLILELAGAQTKKLLVRLGPAPEPSDLEQQLAALGAHKAITQKYMALPLAAGSPLLAKTKLPPELSGLSIYPVDDYGILYQKLHPRLGKIDSAKKRCLVQAYQKLAEQSPRQHWTYLAEWDGKLIASVGLFLHQKSIAGYDLLVLPEYRRQGIGTAMLAEIACFMVERGANLGVLATSVQGRQFYPQLGAAHIGGYPLYAFRKK